MPRRPPGSDVTSVWFRPAPAARQPAPAFSRDEITRAAIDLADRGGLEAVSMRRIAARIGSAPTSLYWYVSNKEELYELMVDACIGLIPLPERPSRRLARRPRGHRPGRSPHIERPPLVRAARHPPGRRTADPAVRRCNAAVVRRPRPRPGHRGQHPGHDQQLHLRLRTAGSGLAAAARTSRTRRRTLRYRAVRAQANGALPGGMSAEHLSVRTELHGDDSFEFGLDCLLEGIAVRIGRARDQDS